MRLTDHFTLDELTHSQTAARLGLANDPPPDVVQTLIGTAHGLEMVRALLQAPILISSGYRSPALNAAIGGAQNSDHTRGDAADFICPGFGAPSTIVSALKDSGIQFDQLIEEFGRWVHISFGPRMRGQVLRIDRNGTRPWM